jgi:hypothetical protein
MNIFEEHLNKTSNTLRVIGAIPMVLGLFPIMLSAIRNSVSFDAEFAICVALISVGITMQLISSFLWRIISRHGDPHIRLIYYYNHDIKRLD